MAEDNLCMVCNNKIFVVELQEDNVEIPEMKKGNRYCMDCYKPLQQQFKLTVEDIADISSVNK